MALERRAETCRIMGQVRVTAQALGGGCEPSAGATAPPRRHRSPRTVLHCFLTERSRQFITGRATVKNMPFAKPFGDAGGYMFIGRHASSLLLIAASLATASPARAHNPPVVTYGRAHAHPGSLATMVECADEPVFFKM